VLLLALDTSSPAVTVAVHDGQWVLATRTSVDARRHGELLAPLVAEALADAGAAPGDLTDVVVGVGPGPYTGLRIGLVTARTVAAVTGATVQGACSLDVLGLSPVVRASAPGRPVMVVTDARRQEVHWAAYDAEGRRTDGPRVERPRDLAAGLPPGTVLVGRGAQLYADVFAAELADGRLLAPPLDPDAAVLAQAVVDGRIELGPAEPCYLRRPDATPPGPPKPVLPAYRR